MSKSRNNNGKIIFRIAITNIFRILNRYDMDKIIVNRDLRGVERSIRSSTDLVRERLIRIYSIFIVLKIE
jgi:hypothetical protein